MERLVEMLKTDELILAMAVMMILLLLVVIVMLIRFSVLNKRYKSFMKKLGNGKDIQEDLENYIHRVDKVEKQNGEIQSQVEILNTDLKKCIQKVGIVRYSAFKDTGSDLSFTLALLDENNDGVVLNGIYSREMSNIYAKPVKNGESTYTISEEEAKAIQKAIESDEIIK